jgi:hypothetical protein
MRDLECNKVLEQIHNDLTETNGYFKSIAASLEVIADIARAAKSSRDAAAPAPYKAPPTQRPVAGDGYEYPDSAPECPECGKPMSIRHRRNDGAPFYGCSGYPGCRGIVSIPLKAPSPTYAPARPYTSSRLSDEEEGETYEPTQRYEPSNEPPPPLAPGEDEDVPF